MGTVGGLCGRGGRGRGRRDAATSWAARAIVAEVPGIAEVIIAGAKPGGDQSTPGQPSESPNETSTSTSTIASPAQEIFYFIVVR